MKECTITVSLRNKNFESHFAVEEDTPEYLLADEAYRLALMFVETQAIAMYGYFTHRQFADLLKEVDYNYVVEEVKCVS